MREEDAHNTLKSEECNPAAGFEGKDNGMTIKKVILKSCLRPLLFHGRRATA